LQHRGARHVAVSLGASGVIRFGENSDSAMIAVPPNVQVVSTVGCGDATVAGFAVAARRGLNEEESLRLAVACGAANCLAKLPGQIKPEDVGRLRDLVSLKKIDRKDTRGK